MSDRASEGEKERGINSKGEGMLNLRMNELMKGGTKKKSQFN